MLLFFEVNHLYISLAVLGVALLGLWVQGRSLPYLVFCAVFGIYLIGVVSVVVFPIHIPEADIGFNPELRLNLVPFNFGTCDFLFLCLRNIYENILLTVPFGFGISFIARLKSKHFLWLAILIGIMFEASQLIISLVFRSSFRAVDINDVILNAIGVLLGYGIFRIFGWLYLYITQRFEISNKYVFVYIYEVVRHSTNS